MLGVSALALGLLVPGFGFIRAKNARIGCVSRLKNIGLGFRIYASDNRNVYPMALRTNAAGAPVWSDATPMIYLVALSNVLSIPQILVCPADRARRAAQSFRSVQRTNISYFVGLDATEQHPQSFLAGDRNLTTNGSPLQPGLVELTTNTVLGWTAEMHRFQGNVAMGDGSVQQFSVPSLSEALTRTELATNRLAVP